MNVISEMTATVWKIDVGVGQQVNEDDSLMVLEAMKMEIPIIAPRAGTVVALEVAEGDAVKDGQLLARIE